MLVRRKANVERHQAVGEKRIDRARGLNRELRVKFHRILQIAQTLLEQERHLLQPGVAASARLRGVS